MRESKACRHLRSRNPCDAKVTMESQSIPCLCGARSIFMHQQALKHIRVNEIQMSFSWKQHVKARLEHIGCVQFQEPKEVLLPEGVKTVSAGSYHTLYLTESGDVWASGSNSHGQLGLGEGFSASPAPRRIPSLAGLYSE